MKQGLRVRVSPSKIRLFQLKKGFYCYNNIQNRKSQHFTEDRKLATKIKREKLKEIDVISNVTQAVFQVSIRGRKLTIVNNNSLFQLWRQVKIFKRYRIINCSNSWD